MNTFSLILQVFFGWILRIIIIGLLIGIYQKQKHNGWKFLLIGFAFDFAGRVISTGYSFWIRESVHLEDLESAGSTVLLITTLLNIIAFGIIAAGIFFLFNDIKKKITSPAQPQASTPTATTQTTQPQPMQQQTNPTQPAAPTAQPAT